MKKNFIVLLGLLLISFIHAEEQSQTEYFVQGKAAYENGEYEKAVSLFEKDLEELNKDYDGNETLIATTYNYVGNCYQNLNKYEKSIEYQNKSLEIRLRLYGEDKPEISDNYSNIGESYFNLGNYEKALEYKNKALELCLKLFGENYYDSAACYNDLGVVHHVLGNNQKAYEYYSKALELCLKLFGENHIDSATSYDNVGLVYQDLGNYEKALEYGNKALEIRLKLFGENHLDSALSYNHIGILFCILGNYERANEYFTKALEIRLKLLGEKHPDSAEGYNNVGLVYSDLGNFEKALEYYNKALEICLNIYGENHLSVIGYYSNIGVAYIDLGNYEKALEYGNKALEISLSLFGENHPDTASCYTNIGLVYSNLGNYEKSLEYENKAMEIRLKLFGENHPDLVLSYNNIGCSYNGLENYEKGLEYYNKSLEILGENHPLSVELYDNLGEVYHLLGNNKKAKEYYKKWLYLSATSQRYYVIINTSWNHFLGVDILQSDFLQSGISAVERARIAMPAQKSQILAKAIPLYYAGVDLSAQNKEYDQAFEYSESLRSRGFLEEIGTDAALSLDEVTEDERKNVKDLMSSIQTLTVQLDKEKEKMTQDRNEEMVKEFSDKLDKATKDLESLEKQIGKRVPKYTQLRNPTVVSADDAKKWCGKNRVILEYVMWNEDYARSMKEKGITFSTEKPALMTNKSEDAKSNIKSYCLVITKNKITAVELDSEFDYDNNISDLRDAVNRGGGLDSGAVLDSRKVLYEKLIKPVEKEIPWRTKDIVIVPDGNLSSLPFEILGDGEGKDFGDRYNLSFSPSVSVSMMKQKKTGKKQNLLAIGNAVYNTESKGVSRGASSRGVETAQQTAFDAKKSYETLTAGEYYAQRGFKWNNLPGTGVEINAIQEKVFGKDNSTLYENADSTEKLIKYLSACGELSKYSVFHLACHGYYNATDSDMSSVVLSEVSGSVPDSQEDGYMTIEEIALLNLDSDFMNLSACQTGLSKNKRGDGMTGLTRSCIVAGSDKVGATLWEVDDEATCEFMIRMYSKVKKGKTYQQAYHETKQEFKKSEDFDLPYFWAAFVLYE